jgi:hypothetical protein
MPLVSCDLAVWEGDRPSNDAAACEEYRQLYERHAASGERQPPTPRITAYVHALLARYPEIDTNAGEDSPWADAPLMGDASGPFIYLSMVYSHCDEASAWSAHPPRHAEQ